MGYYLPGGTGLSDLGIGLLVDEPIRGLKVATWVSLMLKKDPPPSDWWMLHITLQYWLQGVLTDRGFPVHLFVLCCNEGRERKLWWCPHKQDQHRYPWFIAVEDPTTASAAVQSRQSWDDILKWMVASGMHS